MHYSEKELLAKIPDTDSLPFYEFFKKGDFSMEIYKPILVDIQSTHNQDEIYIIASGSGTFDLNGQQFPFKQNDFIFVPAHAEHRFLDFTSDFTTWVIFFGPKVFA